MSLDNKKLIKPSKWQMLKQKLRDLRSLLWLPELMAQASCIDQSTTQTQSALPSLDIIQSLKELPLKSFIACSCFEQFDVLVITKRDFTDADREVMKLTWMKLLSEYYLAKQDRHSLKYIECVCGMERIKFRAKYIDFLCSSITVKFTERIAELLRKEFKQLKFTRESYQTELQYVYNIEKSQKLQYDQYKAEFERLERGNTKATTQTPQQREHAFYKSVIGINSVMKSNYDVSNLNTLTYALLLHEVENQIEEAEKNKRK